MWKHYCHTEKEELEVGDGEECNWCGSDAEAVTIDGFDDAIIGFEPSLWKVVYSRTKCVDICVKDGMNEEEAADYLEYNTFAAHVGEKTPIWVDDYKY